jgi:hypothetical protein
VIWSGQSAIPPGKESLWPLAALAVVTPPDCWSSWTNRSGVCLVFLDWAMHSLRKIPPDKKAYWSGPKGLSDSGPGWSGPAVIPLDRCHGRAPLKGAINESESARLRGGSGSGLGAAGGKTKASIYHPVPGAAPKPQAQLVDKGPTPAMMQAEGLGVSTATVKRVRHGAGPEHARHASAHGRCSHPPTPIIDEPLLPKCQACRREVDHGLG